MAMIVQVSYKYVIKQQKKKKNPKKDKEQTEMTLIMQLRNTFLKEER